MRDTMEKNKEIKRTILLNPGPATTTDSVKHALVVSDICHREKDFTSIVDSVRKDLTRIATKSPQDYASVLFTSSGTGAVEATISSVVPPNKKILIVNNGAYGQRMIDIAKVHSIGFVEDRYDWTCAPNLNRLERIVTDTKDLECIGLVHHETTSGLLNPMEEVGAIAKRHNLTYIVDAMSSFAGRVFDAKENNIDFLISSSNKCIQGIAGISFVICNREELERIREYPPRTVYFDVYAHYKKLESSGETPFTPAVQTIYALRTAIDEFFDEGAIGRQERYSRNWHTLVKGMDDIGFRRLHLDGKNSNILTSFVEPDVKEYNFDKMHDLLYQKGFTIYPGKVGDARTFRIANLGAINYQDIERFIGAMKQTLDEMEVDLH